MVIAQELERAARKERAVHSDLAKRVVRARHERLIGGQGLTQRETALLLGMTERGVRAVENRALRKLRRHPALRAIWGEWFGEGSVSVQDVELSDAELAAVYALAWTRAERTVLDKILALLTAPVPLPPSNC